MTRLNLLDALTSFTNEVMRETLLPVRRQKGDEEEPAERPPLVYRQRLPDVKSATSKAPYILHQIVTGEDEQKPGEPTDSSVEVRSLSACTAKTIRKVRCGCLRRSSISVKSF